jgi:hypothetical protein
MRLFRAILDFLLFSLGLVILIIILMVNVHPSYLYKTMCAKQYQDLLEKSLLEGVNK